jgi:hypothetical protein
MANCVTCGKQLHPERAEKYDYCTEPECQERNATGLEMVAVGVNKAADQYAVLNERTKQNMARGRYKKQPEAAGSVRMLPRNRPIPTPSSAPDLVTGSSASVSRPRWSEAQENLAVIYRAMGMKPHEIAKKLGVTEYLVIKILLAATAQGRR